MKKFYTANTLVSLENVLRIDLTETSYTYTRKGVKIDETAYSIQITYVNGQMNTLRCGVNAQGKTTQTEWFAEIVEIL